MFFGFFIKYDLYVSLDIMDLFTDILILHADTMKRRLEEEIHHIEKKRNIEYSISHSEYLPCCRYRYQITKSYGCCRDDSEVERIEVALSYRMSELKSMYQDCSYDPTNNEDESDSDEFPMMKMKHRKNILSV